MRARVRKLSHMRQALTCVGNQLHPTKNEVDEWMAMLEMEAELYCARGAVMAVRTKRTGFGGKHIGKF